eukprot:135168_1
MYYFKKEKLLFIEQMPLDYTLSEYINTKDAIDENECKLIILNILSKIWTLHKAGIIHCDLKPSNIMFGNFLCKKMRKVSLQWHVIDFGVALHQKEYKNKWLSYRGTYQWSAPEINVQSNKNKYSYAVDIW